MTRTDVPDGQPKPGAAPDDLRARRNPIAAAPQGRYMELEAFRGVAALAVVVYHAFQYSGLQQSMYADRPSTAVLNGLDGAVAFFLSLSGFLLFLPIASAALGQTGLRSARGFLARRAVRIIPLYVIAITVVWALRTPSFPGRWQELVTHLTFTHIYFDEYIFTTIGPAWSLAVEVVFYLLLALLAPLAYRVCGRLAGRGSRITLLVGLVAVLTLVSVAFKIWAAEVAGIPGDRYSVYFSPLARLDNFSLGMGLAVLAAAVRGRWTAGTTARVALRSIGLLVLVGAVVARTDGGTAELLFHSIVALGATLLFASSTLGPRGTTWERALSWRPLGALGLWSYSIYIWHESIMQWLGGRELLVVPAPEAFVQNAVVMVIVATAVGFLSYWIIEYPATHLRFLLREDAPRR